jgi:hypothetical protein
MNKRGILILALASFILIISTISLANAESYISDDSLKVSVFIDAPSLKINVVEDSIYLGNITKGSVTASKPFNITNTGTADALIQPIVPSSEIFSNLFIANTSSASNSQYQRATEFIGRVGKGDKADFWIRLDLKNYTGTVTGNLSTNLTFIIMSA